MTAFDRPGEWRLVPEPKYKKRQLQKASSPEEFMEIYQDLLAEGREGLQRIEALDQELRDTAREERRVELELQEARQQAKLPPHQRLYPKSSEYTPEDKIEKLTTELNKLVKLRQKLEEDREELAKHLARNFVALRVEPDRPDLTPLDLEEERRKVGEPVDAWWTPR